MNVRTDRKTDRQAARTLCLCGTRSGSPQLNSQESRATVTVCMDQIQLMPPQENFEFYFFVDGILDYFGMIF